MSKSISKPFSLGRSAVFAATVLSALVPATPSGVVAKAAVGLTVSAIVAVASDAEARPLVRDHRTPSHKRPK